MNSLKKPNVVEEWEELIINDGITKDFLNTYPLNQTEYDFIIRFCIDYNLIDTTKLLLFYNKKYYKFNNNKVFQYNCSQPVLGAIESFLNDEYTDSTADNQQAFINSCQRGMAYKVRFLLEDERIDPSAQNNLGFSLLCSYNGTDILELVQILLKDKRIDPAVNNNQAFVDSLIYGDLEVSSILSQDERIIPKDDNSVFCCCCNRAISSLEEMGEKEEAQELRNILKTKTIQSKLKVF